MTTSEHSSDNHSACLKATPLEALSLSEVTPQEHDFLWEPWVAYGELTLLCGDTGAGKSLLCADLVSRKSRGLEMPDGAGKSSPGTILLMAVEDSIAKTLRPRLDAAGTDTNKVRVIEQPVVFPEQLPQVEATLVHHQASFVVIDCLGDTLSGGIGNYQVVRRALLPLRHIAERTNSAVLMLLHVTKAQQGKAIYGGIGSIGIPVTTRSVLFLAEHPKDRDLKVLCHAKTNIGPRASSLLFKIVQAENHRPRIEWLGKCEHTAESLFGRRSRKDIKLQKAQSLLLEDLANGPVGVNALRARANNNSLSWRTMQSAKAMLGIASVHVGFGPGSKHHWKLPEAVP